MKNKIRIVIGIVICLAGTACFLYPAFREWRTQQEIQSFVEVIEEARVYLPDEADNDTVEASHAENNEAEHFMPEYQELYEEMEHYNEQLISDGQEISDAFGYEDSPVEFSLDSYGITAMGWSRPVLIALKNALSDLSSLNTEVMDFVRRFNGYT